MILELARRWQIGPQLGAGGFGHVFAADGDDGTAAVAKFVPKVPGAERELLFVQLDNVRNAVPVIDYGDTSDDWVLVMPRADRSLRDELTSAGGPLPLDRSLAVLRDVATALADMDGRVVHRDLKPENVLLLHGRWCLADFGISRYAEASTAPDTRKFAMSPPYAAPERWRLERATIAADVYALGVLGVELLTGQRPFPGPRTDDYREQHLHADPGRFAIEPPRLAALLQECLYKAPGARPTPASLLARLEAAAEPPRSSGAGRLARAYGQQVAREGDERVAASRAQTELERREDLAAAALSSFRSIARDLLTVVKQEAPTAKFYHDPPPRFGGWSAELNGASLSLEGPDVVTDGAWGGSEPPAFDVIAYGSVGAHCRPNGPWGQHLGYAGRSHSLYFCDATVPGNYAWFETAFMHSPLRPRQASSDPFALPPGRLAALALRPGIAEYQVAWPFTALVIGDLDEFVDRWLGWFADAIEDRLVHPSTMPEKPVDGTWRRS